MKRSLKFLLLATDLGFLLYWAVTGFHLIPPQWAYQDYTNPLLVQWNWSFFPLDLLASATGLAGFLLIKHRELSSRLILVSLTLTSSSGLNALAFWSFRGEFDVAWWVANAFLLLWPVPYLIGPLRKS